MNMKTWADLHGEDGSFTPFRPSKTAEFCMNCQCWVERADMKRWSADGSIMHFLCDGCDADLLEPEIME